MPSAGIPRLGRKAKAALKLSIARRLKAAEDQIASAEADAVRAVRDRATDRDFGPRPKSGQTLDRDPQRAGIDKAIEDGPSV